MLHATSADIKKAPPRGNSQPPPAAARLVAPPVPALGNQATLRLMRKCDCAGAPDCDCDVSDHKKKNKDSPSTALHRKPSGSGALAASSLPGASTVLDGETRDFFEDRLQRKELPHSAAPSQTGPSITIGAVDDPLEHEADNIADRVMRMPGRAGSISSATPRISRKCAPCQEEQAKLRKKGDVQAPALNEAPQIVHGVVRSPGQPLDPASRAFFETRFGGDLSGVRIHDNAEASASAHAVRALAYTVGQHIAFAGGQYQPGTDGGRRLLAHELAHTFQQRGASVQGPERTHHSRQSRPALRRQKVGDFKMDPCITAPVVGQLCGQKAADVCKKVSLPGCGLVCKLFDCGKTKEPRNTCPPGFHPGHSKDYQDQCCKDSAGSESDHDCCPGDRLNMFGTCCPVGQVPDGMTCTPAPSLPIPDLCPKEWKTSLGKCCVPPQKPGMFDCVDAGPVNPPPGNKTPGATPTPAASSVYFNLDRPHPGESKTALNSCLTGEGAANLKTLIAQLKTNPGLKVQLVGRASPEGDFKYNLDLGARRAQMVAGALMDAGIGSGQIADAPGSGAPGGCQPIGAGISTCGEIGSTGERDRQVSPTLFATATPPPAAP